MQEPPKRVISVKWYCFKPGIWLCATIGVIKLVLFGQLCLCTLPCRHWAVCRKRYACWVTAKFHLRLSYIEKVGKKILFRVLLLSERHSRGNKEGLRSWSCVCRINHALSQLIIGNFKLSCHGNKFFLYPHRNCELKKSNVFNGNNKSPYPFKKAYSYIEGPIYRPWCGCTTKQPGAI